MIGTTPTDRELLAEISRWARANGWTRDWRGVHIPPGAAFGIDISDGRDGGGWLGFRVMRGSLLHKATDYEVDDVRQAVDLLVALTILPPAFSSQYRLGRRDGEWIAKGWDTEGPVAGLHALADAIAAGRQQVPAVTVVYDGTTRMRVVPRVIHDLICGVRVATPQDTTPVVLGCAGCGFCYPQEVTR